MNLYEQYLNEIKTREKQGLSAKPIDDGDLAAEIIVLLPEGTRYQLLAPVVRGKKGTHTKLISGLAAEGFARVRINGEVRELADSIELDKNQIHNIEVVVDRLIAREGIQERLNDSLQTCLKRGELEFA